MGAAFSDSLRNARSGAIVNAINNGAGSGTMLFYTSPQPAKGAAITTQTLLGIAIFAEPAGTIINGVLTLNAMIDGGGAAAGGNAAWVRVIDGDGAFVMDMPATDNNGAGPVKMPSTLIFQGGIIKVDSAVFTEGNN